MTITEIEQEIERLIQLLELKKHVERMEADNFDEMSSELFIAKITEIVAERHNIRIAALKSKSRLAYIVLPRMIIFFLSRKLRPEISARECAKPFGMHVSNVTWACKTIQNRIDTDRLFADKILDLELSAKKSFNSRNSNC